MKYVNIYEKFSDLAELLKELNAKEFIYDKYSYVITKNIKQSIVLDNGKVMLSERVRQLESQLILAFRIVSIISEILELIHPNELINEDEYNELKV